MNDPLSTWYELRDAVGRRDFADAEKLLSAEPGLTDRRNGIGETVLHYVAVEGDMEGVAWLHAHGFDLDTANKFGTPLAFEVALTKNRDLLKWLHAQGANFEALNADGDNISEYLLEFNSTRMAEYVAGLVT